MICIYLYALIFVRFLTKPYKDINIIFICLIIRLRILFSFFVIWLELLTSNNITQSLLIKMSQYRPNLKMKYCQAMLYLNIECFNESFFFTKTTYSFKRVLTKFNLFLIFYEMFQGMYVPMKYILKTLISIKNTLFILKKTLYIRNAIALEILIEYLQLQGRVRFRHRNKYIGFFSATTSRIIQGSLSDRSLHLLINNNQHSCFF